MVRNSGEIDGKRFDVAILGGGLGGLQCGYILAKNGLNVCVIEKNPLAGGCLQSFRRRGAGDTICEFDTGLHYVGGLDEGQPLNRLFSYFGLLDLPWQKMDPEGFDEVIINGKSYLFANGHNEFAERMTEYFPHEKENILKYTALLKKVGESLPKSLSPKSSEDVYTGSLFAESAHKYLTETIGDPLLREVLSGTSLKMELSRNLPLYTFAQINNSFIESAYRLQGGGNMVTEKLIEGIEGFGGSVAVNCEVTSFAGNKIIINNIHKIEANKIISDLHPAATMNLASESAGIRKVYRSRINRLENTFGMFTANIALKPCTVKYHNRNRYIHKLRQGRSLWDASDNYAARPTEMTSVLASYYNSPDSSPANQEYTDRIDLLTPMSWNEVEQFQQSSVGKRDRRYNELKEAKLEQVLDFVEEQLPQLRGNIERVYTSTPLTYMNYTATAQGSAYGIKKDCSNLMLTLLTPKTPVPNLFLTGQNLNLHGILGVSMTSFFTSAHIIGMENAVKGLEF